MSTSGSRRLFLKHAGALSVLGGAAPFALNLAGIGAAAAQAAPDYKALVCLFLFGGNDQTNTVIPYDQSSYDAYAAARPGLERPRDQLVPIVPATAQGGRQFALPPELAPLATLFSVQRAAVIANVGPLIEPIADAAAYRAGRGRVPPKLFSHNDQQAVWQAYSPEGARFGWGGRLADLLASQNSTATFTAISAAGNAVWLSGRDITQYQISSSGAVQVNGLRNASLFGAPQGAAALRSLLTADSAQLLEKEHARVTGRSIDAATAVGAALASLPASDSRVALPAGLSANRLAQQLQIVARMVGVQGTLGARRQVFFVSLGGFDTHDNQLTSQPGLHTTLAQAVDYFHTALAALGASNNVTLFTASDFGRTLTTNGDGSDHGWGAHHFVVGGAVRGGDIYGVFPEVRLGTTDDIGSGRLLPRQSVDQYAATLARWFGVSDSDLPLIAPNIGNFATRTLGFM